MHNGGFELWWGFCGVIKSLAAGWLRRYFAILTTRQTCAYLSHRRLVLKESPVARRQIAAHFIVRHIFDVLDGRAEEFVLEETRVGETVTSRLAAFTLLLARLWWVLVGLCDGRVVCFPIVVASGMIQGGICVITRWRDTIFVRTNLHGMKRSEGDDDSGAAKRRRAVGLQCLSKRFSYSGLNIFFPNSDEWWFVGVNELRSCVVGGKSRSQKNCSQNILWS